ncbi:MAG: TolC family protein [Prolixibacteraceae bacterium]|nr:TolC family protein [Prolixibacteraceae bacterium]
MMKRNSVCIAIISLAFSVSLTAQDAPKQWTLHQCISYAKDHNIEIKQNESNIEQKKITHNTDKFNWLPSLNANTGQNFDFGRSADRTGMIEDRNSSSSSLGVQMSINLFNGLKTVNNTAASELSLKAAVEHLNKAKEDLSISITNYYVQVLYNKELEKVQLLQVELTRKQADRTKKKVNAGKSPISDLYQIESQLATDKTSLLKAKNEVKLSLLNLKQNIELECSDKDFEITTPVEGDVIEKYMGSMIMPDIIFDHAVTFKPQIKEQQFLIEQQKKLINVARADYLPKLSLNLNYNNYYYHNYSDDINASFLDQIDQNQSKTIGFSLSIPIFNKFTIRNNIRSVKVNILDSHLMMDETKKQLYKEIQQAFLSASNSQQEYQSACKEVKANKIAFEFTDKKYTSGRISVYEFNETKTKYAQSLARQAQAKYNYIFRVKILDFYNGVPLVL